jgi:hypothetical protein
LQSRGAGLRCEEELTSGTQLAAALREGRGKWAGGGGMGRKRGSRPAERRWATGKTWAGGKERERRRWAAGFWAKREGVKGLGFCFFQTFSNLNIFKILFKTFQIILKLLKLHTITHKHHASKT